MLHGVSPDMKQIQLRYIEGIINCCGVEKDFNKMYTPKTNQNGINFFMCRWAPEEEKGQDRKYKYMCGIYRQSAKKCFYP